MSERDATQSADRAAGGMTTALIRETLARSGQTGLPEPSLARIRAGLAKVASGDRVPPGRAAAPAGADAATWRRRAAVAAVILAILLLLPVWLVAGALFLAVAFPIWLYYAVGHDRYVGAILAWFRRVEARDPARAERILTRAARVSARIDRIAAHLPERWTRGLYLPDFEPPEDLPEKMKADPFERLAPRFSGSG